MQAIAVCDRTTLTFETKDAQGWTASSSQECWIRISGEGKDQLGIQSVKEAVKPQALCLLKVYYYSTSSVSYSYPFLQSTLIARMVI